MVAIVIVAVILGLVAYVLWRPAAGPAVPATATLVDNPERDAVVAAARAYDAQSTHDTISNIVMAGSNAKGNGVAPGGSSGYEFIAHKNGGTWQVVYRGQQLPGRALGERYGLPGEWYARAYE